MGVTGGLSDALDLGGGLSTAMDLGGGLSNAVFLTHSRGGGGYPMTWCT